MPYCTYCGTENPPDGKFCKNCGKPLDTSGQLRTEPEVPTPVQPAWPVQPVQRSQRSTAETLILGVTIFYIVAAVLIVFTGSVLGFMGIILPAVVAVVLYLAAYQPLKRGNVQRARSTALGIGVLTLLFALIDFMIQDLFAALLALIAGAALLYAWNMLRSEGTS